MVIGINCGHTVSGTVGCGAIGYLNESDETRNVGYILMHLLKKNGHKVIDCTNDFAHSVSDNLRQICSLANNINLDMFLSIHFNAGGGKGSEVFTIKGKDKACAGKILKSLETLGFKNRGIKDGSHLYVIKNVKYPSALIEVCFVDSNDADLYTSVGAEKIALSIYNAIAEDNLNTTEELTMTQYEELKNEIKKLREENIPMVYNYIDDNMPEWARPTIKKLVNLGILKGGDDGLNLTEDLLRLLVINDRAGLYDK